MPRITRRAAVASKFDGGPVKTPASRDAEAHGDSSCRQRIGLLCGCALLVLVLAVPSAKAAKRPNRPSWLACRSNRP